MLSDYIPICNAIVQLMNPLVEIVIHDITHNTIVYINGSISDRKIGDGSLIDAKQLNDLQGMAYSKVNFDGKLIKSISIIIDDNHLLCINCDVSIFNAIQALSNKLLQTNNQPQSLFINDWQERLHISVHNYLKNHSLSFDRLSKNDKKCLTKYLFDMGAFHEKNAADYVAKILKLGRATVFKYLKEWRNQ